MAINTIVLVAAFAAFMVATLARLYMQSVFKRHLNAFSKHKWTGLAAAETLLKENMVDDVRIERIEGIYNDRFIPDISTLMISSGAYQSSQVVAIVSLLFETARAVLYKKGFGILLRLRVQFFSLFNVLSWAALPAMVILPVLGRTEYLIIPVAAFAANFVMAILTFPLDYATARLAGKCIVSSGKMDKDEQVIARATLRACVLTYIAMSFKVVNNIIRFAKGSFLPKGTNNSKELSKQSNDV